MNEVLVDRIACSETDGALRAGHFIEAQRRAA